mgnify:CR=1 FL=1
MGLTSPSAYPVDIKTGIEGFSLSIHGDIDSLFSFYEGWNEPSKSPFRFPDRSYLGLTSEYKNVGIDASYYIYKPWEEGSLAEYSHFWHKIYFYWKFSDEFMFKVGMFDLNFALKFDSTWWMSILWCLGMEEPYDTGLGIEYHGKKTPIGLYLSYFRDKEGTYDQPATYDPAPGTGEKDIIVGRLIYPFQLAEGTKLELGIAGYHGRTQEYTINDVDWTEGDRTMFDADAVLSIGDNLTFSAEFIRFNFNTKASDGSKWMPMSGFGMPDYYSTPLEGSTYWLDGMYTKPLDFKFLQSVSVANNFSAIIPKDGENIYQNTVSLQFQSVSTYTWIEWIMYKDDNLPDAKWDWMLTTILRYSF